LFGLEHGVGLELAAKNMPGFAPVGPFIMTMDEVPDTDDLWVTCDVNGKQRLRSNTGDYLYKIR
jgi:2-keto-4-pentenoate hydratase/2-oxohepta-3-ene-1,7-dioic acid hydratase in catechol pathway